MEHKSGRNGSAFCTARSAAFWQDAVFFLLLALTAVFFCWRCRYGYANWDESFYLTIPRRLAQGDRLLIDEWHGTQLSAVALYLPVLLFEKLTGGTEGIYLAFRYLCVAAQALTAAAVYLRLRRYHRTGAAVGALALAVYTPFGINALSYYSMGVLFMALTGALLVPAERYDRAVYVLAGLCFAGAVLCCPFLALVYLLYAGAVVVLLRKKRDVLPALSPRAFGLFTLGAAILAVYFFAVGLAGADLSGLPEALRGILSDPEHQEQRGMLFFLLRMGAEYPLRIAHFSPGGGVCLSLVVLLAIAARRDKRRDEHAGAYFLAGAFLTAAAEVLFFAAMHYINFMMLAVNVFALLCFALAPRTPSGTLRRLGYLWWLPGLLYSWFAMASSNQTVYAAFSAAASTVPCSAAAIWLTGREIFPRRTGSARHAAAALAVLAALQIGCTAFLRYWNVFWDRDIRCQTETIAEGTHRGLVVEPYRVGQFAASERVIRELERRAAGEPVLPLAEETWMFMGDYRNGAYSAWLSGVSGVTLDRLEAYYALHPEKLPAAAWTASENAAYAGQFCDRFGYTAEETPDGIFLMPENG